MNERFLATVTVPGRMESVRPAACFLVETARSLKIPAADNRLFEVAIVEALNNALTHNPRSGEQPLHCELEVEGRCLRIRVLDQALRAPVALALPTGALAWPDTADGWQDLPESGYGLYLIQAVFPQLRPFSRGDKHGVELELTF